MPNCNICQAPTREAFRHQIRDRHLITYFHCSQCGFLQTEEPFWLTEAYERPINVSDTGYVSRNVYLARRTLGLFFFLFKASDTFLDYAGGYGLLTRLMRDYGLNFLWTDPYTPNLFAQGFEYHGEKIAALTCFECFEHFSQPLAEIEQLLKISDTIFFSTKVLPATLPDGNWDYYGFNHGQHLSFYSIKSLQCIARKYGLTYYTDGANLHLFTRQSWPRPLVRALLTLSRLPLEPLFKRRRGSLTDRDHRVLLKS